MLFISTSALAQNKEDYAKVENHKMDSILDRSAPCTIYSKQSEKLKTTTIVRLYRFKNARVKKELSFKTKNNALLA